MKIKLFGYSIKISKDGGKEEGKWGGVGKKKVNNTYEAAYYMSGGANIIGAKVRNTEKLHSWVFEMDNIPNRYIQLWSEKRATCNVDDIEVNRKKLKKIIKKV